MDMRILFTGGGTAGHINPALAVAAYVRARHPEAAIAYVGTPNGMEARLVPQAGFDFIPLAVMGFLRHMSKKNLRHNLEAVRCLSQASHRAREILQDFKPDLVMGTGGYVSGPLLREASRLGIKTATHESNAFPGMTTKLLMRHVDLLMLSTPAAEKHLHPGCPAVVTGTPVREGFLFASREKARRELGIDNRPCIVSFGGSNGAKRINEAIADLIAWHAPKGNLWHIHATGSFGWDYLPELLEERGVGWRGKPNIVVKEYIDNMPTCYAAADLIICRSGATTLSELCASQRASILIPSPNVTANHQYHNAQAMVEAGASVLIQEKDLTGERLIQEVEQLISHPEQLRELGKNAGKTGNLDASQRIYEELMKLLRG